MDAHEWYKSQHRQRARFIETLLDAIADARDAGLEPPSYERIALEYFRASDKSYVGKNLTRRAISFPKLLDVKKRWAELTWDVTV